VFKSADRKGGFPHSEITGSKGARASPVLIAACHVLHRLSTPRHPSEALMRLIVLSKTHAMDIAVSLAAHRAHTCALVISLSQTMMSSQVRPRSSGVKIRRSSSRDDPSFTMSNSPGGWPGENSLFPPIASSPGLVEPDGIEPTTSCLQSTRSTN
jgi:hypothetical protein